MLYSHHQAEPAPLPHRIRFADGSTRTDNTTFTPDELELAGYSGPCERPECNPKLEIVDWDGTQFQVRPYNSDELQEQYAKIRDQRDQLLNASDWTQITDYDLGADRDAWATYRQALRDLPDAPNPFDITWPTPPDLDLPQRISPHGIPDLQLSH
jgi:hypothetical protein